MASVSAHSQETFCHLPRNSVGMLFPKVFCVDVCELRGASRRQVRPDVTRSPRELPDVVSRAFPSAPRVVFG